MIQEQLSKDFQAKQQGEQKIAALGYSTSFKQPNKVIQTSALSHISAVS